MIQAKRKKLKASATAALGPLLTVALGLALLWFPRLGQGLVNLSYDLLFPLFQSRAVVDDLVIIYLDEDSYRALGENPQTFDRAHHARLLQHLTRQGVRLVVFDIFFGDKTSPESDRLLAEAMRANGKVVLPAVREKSSIPGLEAVSFKLPIAELLDSAAGWGVTGVLNPDQVIRQIYPGGRTAPNLAVAAATVAGEPELSLELQQNHWLQHYGPNDIFRSSSYHAATNQPGQWFQGKYVFIGSRPGTQAPFDEVEEFRTPYSRWGGHLANEGSNLSPGVNLVATAFLNLIHGDSLIRLSTMMEALILLFCGGALGFGFTRVGPKAAIGIGLAATVALLLVAFLLFRTQHIWFCWTIIAGGQIPIAFAWALLSRTRKLEVMVKEVTERASQSSPRAPIIPDHILLRRIGRGSYGEVWLGRADDHFNAVKIVYLDSFDSPVPYEREYKGIQKYSPVSSAHPGLVDILMTGRNDALGYFYYAMEIADDVEAGRKFDPDRYVPRTLASELDRRGALPARESLALILTLTEALHHLHSHHLIHRDIKPPNIIYADGVPKFADIGLVTDFASTGKSVTFIGTLGYMAPEGPGTPQADLYSLGKVLYVACLNRDPELFPELPTGLSAQADSDLLRALNRVVGKACQTDPSLRYASAAEMYSELASLT